MYDVYDSTIDDKLLLLKASLECLRTVAESTEATEEHKRDYRFAQNYILAFTGIEKFKEDDEKSRVSYRRGPHKKIDALLRDPPSKIKHFYSCLKTEVVSGLIRNAPDLKKDMEREIIATVNQNVLEKVKKECEKYGFNPVTEYEDTLNLDPTDTGKFKEGLDSLFSKKLQSKLEETLCCETGQPEAHVSFETILQSFKKYYSSKSDENKAVCLDTLEKYILHRQQEFCQNQESK